MSIRVEINSVSTWLPNDGANDVQVAIKNIFRTVATHIHALAAQPVHGFVHILHLLEDGHLRGFMSQMAVTNYS